MNLTDLQSVTVNVFFFFFAICIAFNYIVMSV